MPDSNRRPSAQSLCKGESKDHTLLKSIPFSRQSTAESDSEQRTFATKIGHIAADAILDFLATLGI
jgi:hypothetical protein